MIELNVRLGALQHLFISPPNDAVDEIDERLANDGRKYVAAPELRRFAHLTVVWKPLDAVGLKLLGCLDAVIQCEPLYLRDEDVDDILAFDTGQKLREK